MIDYLKDALALTTYTRTLRRDFHRYPELAFQEVRTASIVARELQELGLAVETGVGETGVVAILEGGQTGPVLLLRFDMDALPIQEETGAEYASVNAGIMHACGHDGHTAIGLTVAKMLNAYREVLAGTVKFVFQPAEETVSGAQRMVDDGVLLNPEPEMALGLHLWNSKPLGWVGVTPGPAMSAADNFRLRITGVGGHGANPHLAVDPILASAQVIDAIQSIVSRNLPPLKSAVVSVTQIHGGDTFNVIPPFVEMEGTIRTFEKTVRGQVLDRFQTITHGIAEAMGCQSDMEILVSTPAVMNDAALAERVQAIVAQTLPQSELDVHERTMGSEDMAILMRDIPGCYFFVGSANEKKSLAAPHHHPKFDFDEDVLPQAAAIMAAAAASLMRRM